MFKNWEENMQDIFKKQFRSQDIKRLMINQQSVTFLKSHTALNMMKSEISLYKDCTFNFIYSYTDLHISDIKEKAHFTENFRVLYDLNNNENVKGLSKVYNRLDWWVHITLSRWKILKLKSSSRKPSVELKQKVSSERELLKQWEN